MDKHSKKSQNQEKYRPSLTKIFFGYSKKKEIKTENMK
jgi:hypothetical protein